MKRTPKTGASPGDLINSIATTRRAVSRQHRREQSTTAASMAEFRETLGIRGRRVPVPERGLKRGKRLGRQDARVDRHRTAGRRNDALRFQMGPPVGKRMRVRGRTVAPASIDAAGVCGVAPPTAGFWRFLFCIVVSWPELILTENKRIFGETMRGRLVLREKYDCMRKL